MVCFFFSSRRRHTRCGRDWSSDVCSSDLPATAARFAEIFSTRTRDEWCATFDGTDACVAPILALGEAHEHPHNRARDLLITDHHGKHEPAPAPRLSRTPGDGSRPLPHVGEHTRTVLAEYGLSGDDIERLAKTGA